MKKVFLLITLTILLVANLAKGQPVATQPAQTIAMARFDCVPFQTFAGNLNVGVVAFHPSGIARVDFTESEPGLASSPISVTAMSLNPQTGIIEYWLSIPASAFPDGPITVNATAYPVSGLPKVLPPLMLCGNSNGTFNPKSITVTNPTELISALQSCDDGAEIFLASGDYAIPANGGSNRINTRWITVCPVAGAVVTMHAATGAGRAVFHDALIKFEGISFDSGLGYLEGVTGIWLDNCKLSAIGNPALPWNPPPPGNQDPYFPVRTATPGGVYFTNCTASQVIYAFSGAALVRNCSCSQVSGRVCDDSMLMLNVSCTEFPGTQLFHPEFYLLSGPADNVIMYGATWSEFIAQGLFIQPTEPVAGKALTNSAFVNIVSRPNDPTGNGYTSTSATGYFSQLQGVLSNVYFKNWNTQDGVVLLRTDAAAAQNQLICNDVVFDACTFHPKQNITTAIPGVTFRNSKNGVSEKLNWPGLSIPTTQP